LVKARRSTRAYCSAMCRKRAERTRRAAAGGDVTLSPACEASLSVTRPGEPDRNTAAAARIEPVDPRVLRGRCAICGMATGERDPYHSSALPDVDVDGAMLHHECAAWLAAGRQARRLAA
jgi:hypothetical protein